MMYKNPVARVLFGAAIVAIVAPLRMFGGAAAIGTVAGSLNATLGGEAIRPNTVVFSGDTLRVEDGAAVVATNHGSRVALGRVTAAEFLKGNDEVVVVLQQGNVSMYHPGGAQRLRVRLGAFSVTPANGFSTLGDVAMINGIAVVTAKQGALRVQKNGAVVEVRQGQTLALSTKLGRLPQGAPSAGAGAPTQHGGGSSSTMTWVGLGVGATGAILGAIGISHASGASNTANNAARAAATANATANSAATLAASATTAAAAALSAADTATQAALVAAETGLAAANTVGCDLNKFANSEGQASPYTPFTGFSCH